MPTITTQTTTPKSNRNSAVRVCVITSTILTAVTCTVFIALCFTVFKPRAPQVVLYPVGLAQVEMSDFITRDNITSEMIVSIRNRNYMGFKFENTTSHITYEGELVGWGSIPEGKVPARSTVNLTASATLMVDKLEANPRVIADILAGRLNLTARVTMEGKMVVVKGVVENTRSMYAECHLTMVVNERPIRGESWCWTKLDM